VKNVKKSKVENPRCVKQNKILKWKIFALTCIESTKNQELSKMHIQK